MKFACKRYFSSISTENDSSSSLDPNPDERCLYERAAVLATLLPRLRLLSYEVEGRTL